jgi:Cys-tRNA(Pro)/Cys-tRNA(Cys) deacylase
VTEGGADTPALTALAASGLDHEVIRTRRADSIEEASELRGVPVAAILKTIVVRRGEGDYVFVLVPGDRAIDWGKLRRHLGVRRLSLPDASAARDATGYERGAITPFGSTQAWPVVADEAVLRSTPVSIGGGAHGVSVMIDARLLVARLAAAVADVTKPA